ncbi:NAD-dependent epimerase [Flavihumibacter sp. R14]|nr:NAD-dependent epimerase [Flavihumibacter soli]
MKILVTGTAGFIGYHTCKALLHRGDEVVGLDNINEYYDVNLKYGRLADTGVRKDDILYGKLVESQTYANYRFIKLDLTDSRALSQLFKDENFDAVCHLAAQAGVRYSLTNPQAYMDSNFQGFLNILESCRHNHIKHFIYASSSSVYGLNKKMPFSAHNNVDHPISLYAASKKSNELMAHTYSYLFGLPTTGLRFFTVYGPWGRPDMAIYLFTKAIIDGNPIQVFNNGNMRRDFTYVDDIVGGLLAVIDEKAKANPAWDPKNPDPSSSCASYRVLNIGRGKPIGLMEFVNEIEKCLGKKAEKTYFPLQDGDVEETWADIDELVNKFGYTPKVEISQGIPEFVKWYKEFYKMTETSGDLIDEVRNFKPIDPSK